MPHKTAYDHGQFCWVDLMTHDVAAARRFYQGLFGWEATEPEADGPQYSIFQLQGADVAGLGEALPDELKAQGVPPCWNSYINVDNLDAALAKVEQLGGAITMPATKVMDAGSMACFTDPTGANVALWQKDQYIGATRTGDPGCFSWNELATRDIERAREFFAALLGWEFADHPETPTKYYIIKNRGNDNGGMIQMNEQWGEIPPCWIVYFTVENADQTVAKVTQLGGAVHVPPFDVSVGRIAVVADPQGGTFSIIQLAAPK